MADQEPRSNPSPVVSSLFPSPRSGGTPKAGLSALKRVVKKTALGKLRVASLFANILGANRKKEDETTTEELPHQSDDEEDGVNDDVDLPDIDVLRTFSPLIVHHQVYQVYSSRHTTKLAPSTSTHFGAVLFADISGFTRLANLLSVEQLQLHISKYFKNLFDRVERFGGDILKICGDAIMIMWPLATDMATSTREERAAVGLVASLCGRDMISSCGTYTAVHGEHRISLSLHCGVGVADVQCYFVGKGGRWEFLISGDALAQIASTEPEAKSGEIVVSAQAYELIEQYVGATKTPRGNFLLSLSEIKPSGVATTGAYPPDDPRFIAGLSDHPTLNFDQQRSIATSHLGRYARSHPDSSELFCELEDNSTFAAGLQDYVHASARSRLRHLGKDFQMAELREVVTIFVNITGLEEDFRQKRLDVIQNVMAVIISSHKCFGGTLRQFVVDDKGCVAIGALGVPYHTYENNAQRGVEIAHLLQVKLQNMGKNCSIGISSGDAFCGLVGSSSRREYAMMGSCINLAARLMCSCEPGTIVVDERVYQAACSTLLFEDKGTVNAKGYADPVHIFCFLEPLLTPNSKLIQLCTATVVDYKEVTPIGRKSQVDSLLLGLRNYTDSSPGCQHQFHFLEGDEGIGKTELCKQVIMAAKAKGAKVIAALCLESYGKSDYWLIAQLLEKIMALHEEEALRKNMLYPGAGGMEDVAGLMSDVSDESLFVPVSDTGTQRNNSLVALGNGTGMEQILEHDFTSGGSFLMNGLLLGAGTPSSVDLNASWKRTRRFKDWAQTHLAFAVNPRGDQQRAMIHGYPVMDIVDLIASVFQEITPYSNPTIDNMNNKQKQLLLKTMLVRVLKVTFAYQSRIFLIENLCKADIASATVISDFIGSSEVAFGIMTYRGLPPESKSFEHEAFRGIRSSSYVVALPNLKERHAAELAASILGPQYRAFLTKEAVSRMYARTKGNPGLLESLSLAILAELENGVTPSVDNVRTHGQQSIVQKVDRLDPPLQLLLKTAAAIGMVLSVRALRTVYDALALKNDMVSSGCDVTYVTSIRRESLEGVVPSGTDIANRDAMGFGNVQLMLNLERLVDAGLFEPIEFKKMTLLAAERVSWTGGTGNGTPCAMGGVGEGGGGGAFPTLPIDGVNLFEVMDTPEISVQAIPWQDARGNKRRGWETVSRDISKSSKDLKINPHDRPVSRDISKSSKDLKITPHDRPFSKPALSTKTPTSGVSVKFDFTEGSPSPVPGGRSPVSPSSRRKSSMKDISSMKSHEYFRFSHPSIHSTAYALSLELDRIPVHAAMIEYLSHNFSRCPGLEETCLHHALLLKDPHAVVEWLMKCSLSARDTYRYALFIQRATQLLSLLTRGECRMESDIDSQTFVLCKSFKSQLAKDAPSSEGPFTKFTYEHEHRVLPNWATMKTDDEGWLLTIGGLMRDVMCAMVRVGDLKIIDQLTTISEELFDGILRCKTKDDDDDDDDDNSLMLSYQIMLSQSTRRRSSALLVLDEVLDEGPSSQFTDHFPPVKGADTGVAAGRKQPAFAAPSRVDSLPVILPSINGATDKKGVIKQTESSSSFLGVRVKAAKDGLGGLGGHSVATASISPRPGSGAGAANEPMNALEGFIAEKIATGALGFQTMATEEAVRSYKLPLLTDKTIISLQLGTGPHKWKVGFVRASYVHAYVRGQEALALMWMLRGYATKALEALEDAVHAINGTRSAEEPCHILQAMCLPRLYSMRSCCYKSDEKAHANRSLIEAELWLSKSKENDIALALEQFHQCVLPSIPGLANWHALDTGEWVLMVVVALRLCGRGMWDGALEEFEGAMAELKEINDKTALFQVRILHAWALFAMGDIPMFHNKMRAIKQYVDHVEEPLTSDAAGELLSFRFSLSCFYDASEILVSKFKAANTFLFGHGDVGNSSNHPSNSMGSPHSSFRNQSLRSNSFRSQKSSEPMLSARGLRGGPQNNRSEFNTLNIYHKVTEAFLISRSRPKDLEVADMIDICLKISQRSPCHYLGGMYLFFTGMAAIATYEHHLMSSCEGLVPTKAADLAMFISAIEGEVTSFADLSKAINEVLLSLQQQSTKGLHPVLLYLFRALKAHSCRMRGHIQEALTFAKIDGKCAAETLPLGVACLKMEIALCRLCAHDDAKAVSEKRENLTTAIASAKEAHVLFQVYEADIEIVTLKRCVADCEDLVREMLPAFSGSRTGSNMTARAYWLDLSCDDESDNEGDS